MSDLNGLSLSLSLVSTNSASSFNFVDVLDPDECQLLSPSISLESLWSIDSDETVPPFPERPAVRITPMLLDDRCMSHPFGRGKKGPDDFKVLTSIATPPRMKHLLLEPLCIDRWVVSIHLVSFRFQLTCLSLEETISKRTPPPGHIAWESSPTAKESSWIPSGSLFSPSDFKHALVLARGGYRKALSAFNPILPRINDRRLPQSGSFRKALVFEHEITLNTEGKQKRWSLQVPAANMNPEMVDIMLELQDLNSFFKDSLVNLDENVAVLEKEKDRLSSEPPALVLSDSHSSFPLPTGSSIKPQRDSSVPLATRRGRRLLPPLALGEKIDKDPYPSIPTAFLGSPSTYSPKFESVLASSGPSLDLEHMVTNLRSQCVFTRTTDDLSPKSPVRSPLSEISFTAASDSENTSDDDWAFAVSFLDEFGEQVAELKSSRAGPHPVIESKPVSLPQDALGTFDMLSNESLTPRAHSPAHPPSPVPSTPLPSVPSPQVREPSSMTPSPRGILKSSKNVRFASLPEKPSVDTGYISATPGGAVGSSIPTVSKANSRPHTYSRSSKQVTVNLSTPGIPLQIRHKKNEKIESPRPLSAYPEVPLSKKPAFSIHQSPLRPHSTVAEARKSTPNLLGRQPFGRLDNCDENQKKKETSASPSSKAGLRWTMNDMTFRRGSTSNQTTPDGTPRSRMPVPLRNILTRFK
ncbi:hypothetical protein J132_06581 [Termitomyces sp. J132]|nr:hypothetical protein J132_06581 [Termitomyces sp. J132]